MRTPLSGCELQRAKNVQPLAEAGFVYHMDDQVAAAPSPDAALTTG